MYHPFVTSLKTIHEDQVYKIGLGVNREGHDTLVIKVKPEGITWCYDLKQGFFAALGYLDGIIS